MQKSRTRRHTARQRNHEIHDTCRLRQNSPGGGVLPTRRAEQPCEGEQRPWGAASAQHVSRMPKCRTVRRRAGARRKTRRGRKSGDFGRKQARQSSNKHQHAHCKTLEGLAACRESALSMRAVARIGSGFVAVAHQKRVPRSALPSLVGACPAHHQAAHCAAGGRPRAISVGAAPSRAVRCAAGSKARLEWVADESDNDMPPWTVSVEQMSGRAVPAVRSGTSYAE